MGIKKKELKKIKIQKKPRLVLMDLDDTLFDTEKTFKIAEKKCFDYLKKEYPLITFNLFEKVYKKARGEINSGLYGTASSHNRLLYFQRLFELFGLGIEPKILHEVNNIYWDYVYSYIKLYPNVKKVLKLLKGNNIKVGIVTDLLIHIQIEKLRRLGIEDYIDFVVSSEEAGKEKPDLPIFLLALKKGGHTAKETIMIGNSIERDIKGAKKIGITTVLKNTFNLKNTKPADYVINDFKEIPKLLKIKKKVYRNKKIVVFDLMGTVFEEGHIISKLLHPLLIKRGYNISYKKLKEIYVKYTLGDIKNKEFWKIVPSEIEKEFLDLIKLDRGLYGVFKKLRKKYLFGVLSNIPKPWGEYLLNKYKLKKFFDTITFSADYHTRKPNEELYITFINSSKIRPENCYFIDDKLINLKESRFLSMKSIWLKKEEKGTLFIPDYKVNNLTQLGKILNS